VSHSARDYAAELVPSRKPDMKASHRLVDVPEHQITGVLELQPRIPD
jgi:hypothetical protein